MLNNFLRCVSVGLAVLALTAAMGLLLGNVIVGNLHGLPAAISAAPLLLVGMAFLIMQPIIRPGWKELAKNLLLAATFLLWGAIQLMPQNAMSKWLGNVVIALYVMDLAWVIFGQVNSDHRNRTRNF
jgi:hypothetical protein